MSDLSSQTINDSRIDQRFHQKLQQTPGFTTFVQEQALLFTRPPYASMSYETRTVTLMNDWDRLPDAQKQQYKQVEVMAPSSRSNTSSTIPTATTATTTTTTTSTASMEPSSRGASRSTASRDQASRDQTTASSRGGSTRHPHPSPRSNHTQQQQQQQPQHPAHPPSPPAPPPATTSARIGRPEQPHYIDKPHGFPPPSPTSHRPSHQAFRVPGVGAGAGGNISPSRYQTTYHQQLPSGAGYHHSITSGVRPTLPVGTTSSSHHTAPLPLDTPMTKRLHATIATSRVNPTEEELLTTREAYDVVLKKYMLQSQLTAALRKEKQELTQLEPELKRYAAENEQLRKKCADLVQETTRTTDMLADHQAEIISLKNDLLKVYTSIEEYKQQLYQACCENDELLETNRELLPFISQLVWHNSIYKTITGIEFSSKHNNPNSYVASAHSQLLGRSIQFELNPVGDVTPSGQRISIKVPSNDGTQERESFDLTPSQVASIPTSMNYRHLQYDPTSLRIPTQKMVTDSRTLTICKTRSTYKSSDLPILLRILITTIFEEHPAVYNDQHLEQYISEAIEQCKAEEEAQRQLQQQQQQQQEAEMEKATAAQQAAKRKQESQSKRRRKQREIEESELSYQKKQRLGGSLPSSSSSITARTATSTSSSSQQLPSAGQRSGISEALRQFTFDKFDDFTSSLSPHTTHNFASDSGDDSGLGFYDDDDDDDDYDHDDHDDDNGDDDDNSDDDGTGRQLGDSEDSL